MNADGRQLARSGISTAKSRLQNLQQWLEEWLQAQSSEIGYHFSEAKKLNVTYLNKNISALALIQAVLSTGWIR